MTELDMLVNAVKLDNNSFEYKSAFVYGSKNLIAANQNLKNQDKKWKWYQELKRESQIYGILCQNISRFDRRNISIEKVLSLISSLFNYHTNFKKQTTYTELPTKFLRHRTQLSRKDINYLVYVLNSIGIIKIKNIGTKIIYMPGKICFIDEFLEILCSINYNKEYRKYCRVENDAYYRTYSKQTIYRNENEVILAIAQEYTNMLVEKILKERRLNDINMYGERTDIEYCIIPVPIIANIMQKSPNKIQKAINRLLNSNYLAKHDKVYVKDNNFNNYYNENYKSHNLVDYLKADIDNEHPVVNNYSYIIFKDNFNNSKISKSIQQKSDMYKEMLLNYLQKYEVETYKEIPEENKELRFTEDKHRNKGISFECKLEKSDLDLRYNAQIITEENLSGTYKQNYSIMKCPKDPSKLSIGVQIGLLKAFIIRIENKGDLCMPKLFNEYTKAVSKLVKSMQNIINRLKSKCNSKLLDRIKERLKDLKLESIFEF